ncbi:MAG TPA: hypothetical protein GXZ58_08980 [Bacilli bacterium]|nr:hypothetical protein [Bacilli bacterium]
MEKVFSRPKQFGEILDLTFRIIKDHFAKLFLLLLAINSPVIIIQVLVQIVAGRGLIRDLAPGENFIEQFINTYTVNNDQLFNTTELSGNFIVMLVSLFVYPIATAVVFLIVKKIKDQQDYELKAVVGESFSRFWPLLGSSILFGIIAFFVIVIPMAILVALIGLSFGMGGILAGIVLIFVLLAALLGILLLVFRWSFYFPITLFDEAPGISASFRLTRGRTWITFGLYITLFLISMFIGSAVEFLSLFLGMSVLYTTILNVVSVFTSMITTVGIAVIYFDLEVRQTGSDLKEMIDAYQ